jgi:hypothetical protein
MLSGHERALLDAWLTHLEDACAVTPFKRAAAQAAAIAARQAKKQRQQQLRAQLLQQREAAAEERKRKEEAEAAGKKRVKAEQQQEQGQQQQAGEGSGADDASGLLPVGAGCLNIPLEVLQMKEQQQDQQQQGAGAQLPTAQGTGAAAGAGQEADRRQHSAPPGAAASADQAGDKAVKHEPAAVHQQAAVQEVQDPYCLVGPDSAAHPTKQHFFAAVVEPEFAAAPALHGALAQLKRAYEDEEAVSVGQGADLGCLGLLLRLAGLHFAGRVPRTVQAQLQAVCTATQSRPHCCASVKAVA